MTRDALKTRIKELAAEGRALREKIRRTSGPERHALWNEKRRVGRRARMALLAYAFLRDVPHARVEPRWRSTWLLHPTAIARRWEEELGIHLMPITYVPPALAVSSGGGWLRFFRPRAQPTPVVVPPVVDSVWTERRLVAWLMQPRTDAVAG